MKVVWLAPYQLSLLRPEIQFARESFPERAAPWIEHLSNELGKNKSIELTLISKSAQVKSDSYFRKNGINFIVLKYGIPFTNKGFPKYLPLDKISWYFPLSRKIRKILNDINPDIVHAHGTESLFAYAAQKSNFPYLISIQGLIHVINKTAKKKDSFQEKIETKTIKNGLYFGCRTSWDKGEVLKLNDSANIKYMPEAMNPLFFNNIWTPSNTVNITFVGNISEGKGVHILIKAFIELSNQIPNISLNLVGGGSNNLRNTLVKELNNSNLSQNVRWHGYLPHKDIVSLLSKSTLFVLPTFMDNSPNSLCEAMVMGIPCIASNVGGIPSLIEDGKNGLLVQKGNIKELSEKMMLLITNKNLRENIGAQAAKDAYQRHYPSMVANQTISVYKEIIEAYAK